MITDDIKDQGLNTEVLTRAKLQSFSDTFVWVITLGSGLDKFQL